MSFLLIISCSCNLLLHGHTLVRPYHHNACSYSKISVSSVALSCGRHLYFPGASLENYFLMTFDSTDLYPLFSVALSPSTRMAILSAQIYCQPEQQFSCVLLFFFVMLPLFFAPLFSLLYSAPSTYISPTNIAQHFEGIVFPFCGSTFFSFTECL